MSASDNQDEWDRVEQAARAGAIDILQRENASTRNTGGNGVGCSASGTTRGGDSWSVAVSCKTGGSRTSWSARARRWCAEWCPHPPPAWVAAVPSLRHADLVPDFARRLADALDLPFSDVMKKTGDRPEQKTMENSDRQARNVVGSLAVTEDAILTGPVLLVDDLACVLADRLERAATHRDHRDALMNDRLVLICPYDPAAGFLVGHAMQRNKLIYALADAALVVSAEFEKGGTWAGAVEQLDRHRFVSVYVRPTNEMGRGLGGLLARGARRWPNPDSAAALRSLLDAPPEAGPATDLPLLHEVESNRDAADDEPAHEPRS